MVNKAQEPARGLVGVSFVAARNETDKQAFERIVESRRQALQLAETKWCEQRDGLIGQLQRCTSPRDNLALPGVVKCTADKLEQWMVAYDQASEEYSAARRVLRRLRGESEDS
jgi:hypothetical protein